MSMPPPPPPPGYPPGYPPYYAPKPPKRRPSAWWFLPGAVALALAVVCGVVGGVTFAHTLHTDGYVDPATGSQRIDLDRAGRHMLFASVGALPPSCTVTEGDSALPLTPETGTETLDVDGVSWRPFASFTTGGTRIEVACQQGTGPVRIGAPLGASEFTRLGLAVIGALALGAVGLGASILVLVLILSRPSRRITG